MSEATRRIEARLKRVEEHLTTLESLFNAFVQDGSAYSIEAEKRPNSDQIVVWGKVLKRPPVIEWAPAVSDVVNGIRASLDNIAWALSVREQRRRGQTVPRGKIPRQGPQALWRNISFPVVIDGRDWKGRCGHALWAIDQALLPTFHDVQPFHTGQNAPHREALAILEELWNIDKHRHVSLVSVWAGGEEVEVTAVLAPDVPVDGIQFVTTWVAKSRVLKLNAKSELAHARYIGPPVGASQGFEVEVEYGVPFEIAFKRGYPGFGRPVVDTLEEAHAKVRSLLDKIRPAL